MVIAQRKLVTQIYLCSLYCSLSACYYLRSCIARQACSLSSTLERLFYLLYISDWSVIQWLFFAAVNQQISHASQSCCVFDWQTQQSSYIYFSPGNWVEEEYLWHRHFVIWKHVERLRRKYNIYFLPVRASQQKATI